MGEVLDRYLRTQLANIAGYTWTPSVGYEKVIELPSIHFLFEEEVFAWWWVGSERPHAFKIAKVEEQGDEVALFHATGKVVISPPWDPEGLVNQWRKEADHDLIMRQLKEAVEELKGGQAQMPKPPKDKLYRVMLELHPDPQHPGRWVIVGAWAANEDEIEYWSVSGHGLENKRAIAMALAEGTPPLQIFQFWYEQANGIGVMRSEQKTIRAPSALAAAQRAVWRARSEEEEG